MKITILILFHGFAIRDQMTRTIEHVQEQNTETPEDIREQIKIFRDKRLSEEQQEQKNVNDYTHLLTYVHNSFTNI